jgi:hypothetical protein
LQTPRGLNAPGLLKPIEICLLKADRDGASKRAVSCDEMLG